MVGHPLNCMPVHRTLFIKGISRNSGPLSRICHLGSPCLTLCVQGPFSNAEPPEFAGVSMLLQHLSRWQFKAGLANLIHGEPVQVFGMTFQYFRTVKRNQSSRTDPHIKQGCDSNPQPRRHWFTMLPSKTLCKLRCALSGLLMADPANCGNYFLNH